MRPKATPAAKTLLLIVLLLPVFTAIPRAQDFQIRTRVDLVVVPVTVKSGDEPVNGLTGEDFVIYEDGKAQTLTGFSSDPVPLSAVILVDAGVNENTFEKVRASFPALAGAFTEFDEVAVFRFDKFVTKLLDFNTDNLLVEGALKRIESPAPARSPSIASGPFSAQGPTVNGIPVIPGSPEPGPRISSPGTKLLHDAVFAAAEELSKRHGDRRRIIIIVSDGQAENNEHAIDDVIAGLLDQGIQVYAIGTDLAFFSRQFSDLSVYAERTGGDACYLNSLDAMESCYFRTTDKARNQYVLAYVSNNTPPGPVKVFRRLEVRAPGRDVEVRHREGYYQYP